MATMICMTITWKQKITQLTNYGVSIHEPINDAASLSIGALKTHHFQQPVQQLVDANFWGTWEVSLVTQSGRKQEIVQIWGMQDKMYHQLIFKF